MSALPPKTEMPQRNWNVRFGPITDPLGIIYFWRGARKKLLGTAKRRRGFRPETPP
jgi:hypothetical protein